MKVGFIGLGRMGQAMAGRLLGGGHELVVYNRSRVDGVGVLDQPVTVGGQTYQPEEVGELIGLARYDDDWMPWVGLGIAGGGRSR